LSSREVVTFFDFPQKGLLIDVATAPTTALALGNGPLLSATLSFLSSRPERTRISCHAAPDKTAYAPFFKERRMVFANATNFYRKSGVAEGRDLRFSGTFLEMFSGLSYETYKSWSGRRGSNPQPTAWEAATLPLSYSRPLPPAYSNPKPV
jgi:hypothetical protein